MTEQYQDDLPNPVNVEEEFFRSTKCLSVFDLFVGLALKGLSVLVLS